jgi:hypothetical protein
MNTPSINDVMAAYAEDAVDYARSVFGIALDYSSGSIEHVESIADKLYRDRPRGWLSKLTGRGPTPDEIDKICKILGGYIGEVFRRSQGGDWAVHDEFNALGVRRDEAWIFPPAKVHKRLENGAEDNLWSYFQIVLEAPWNKPA